MVFKLKKRDRVYLSIIALLLIFILYNSFSGPLFSPSGEYAQNIVSSFLSPPSVSIAILTSITLGFVMGRNFED